MSSERKAILERYAWDRTQDEEELLIRAMMFHNPVELLRAFSREELKKSSPLYRQISQVLRCLSIHTQVGPAEGFGYSQDNPCSMDYL
jgi:hypothetical protein